MNNKTKQIFSAFALMLVLSMSLVLASCQGQCQGERVIVTQSQLKTNYQYQYQLENGEYLDAQITREQAQDQIRFRIRERFRIQNCSCENIQIVELGDQYQRRVAYQVNEEIEGKIFGLFKKKVQVQVNMDIETGEIISMKKPWYMWMVSFRYREAEGW